MMAATPTTEDNAKQLFRTGIECEREGNHYEATRCYKRALKLDPDVEKKIADEEITLRSVDNNNYYENKESHDEYDLTEDLFVRFQRITGPQICFPEHSQQITHFSVLPVELILYILRWVISYNLDLRSLEQCAAVCRGWYLCARDPELWRRACSKFWPSNVNDLVEYNGSWRQMFIERPNVLTIGCYISKVSYVRQGEESFRDNTNGPSFHVVYYRYLRFFSDGRVLMVLTNYPPAKVVYKLQTIEKTPTYIYTGFNKICRGHYKLSGNQLTLTLEANDPLNSRIIMYNMNLKISKYKSKHNWKLHCIDYEVIYHSQIIKESSTKFDLNNNRFPPFIFSRVKCYTNESTREL